MYKINETAVGKNEQNFRFKDTDFLVTLHNEVFRRY